ncbi:SDR family oxidoreductase [Candidatus Woesearchaeota archaeon]|nr:SDR family oxidoreductase [Candidatus Woesearchaeota archaeon]
MKLEGKIVLVTGASRGIGAAIAKKFAVEGAFVIIHYVHSHEKAEQVLKEIQIRGGKGVLFAADIATEKGLGDLVLFVTQQFGKVDILVNNASIFPRKTLSEVHYSDWDSVIHTNLRSVFELSRALGFLMQKNGSGVILNISSDAAFQTKTGLNMLYGLSKSGVLYLTKCFAKEFAPQVRINAICPGYTLTDMSGLLENPEKRKQAECVQLFKRVNDAEDIAQLSLFLVSEDSRNITGESFTINGGAML